MFTLYLCIWWLWVLTQLWAFVVATYPQMMVLFTILGNVCYYLPLACIWSMHSDNRKNNEKKNILASSLNSFPACRYHTCRWGPSCPDVRRTRRSASGGVSPGSAPPSGWESPVRRIEAGSRCVRCWATNVSLSLNPGREGLFCFSSGQGTFLRPATQD